MGNSVYSPLIYDLVPALDLGDTVQAYLLDYEDAKTPDDTLAQDLASNPMYRHFFQRYLKAKLGQGKSSLKDDDAEGSTKLEKPVRFLAFFGKKGCRNLLCALRKMRMMKGQLPRKDTDTYNPRIEEFLPRAAVIDDLLEDKEVMSFKQAYYGALLFDFIDIPFKKKNAWSASLQEQATKQYEKHLMVAQLSYEISKRAPEFPLKDYMYAASLAIGVAKFLLFANYANGSQKLPWKEYEKQTEPLFEKAPELVLRLEQRSYGVSHNEIASFVVRHFAPLAGLDKAVHYFREPFYLKTEDQGLYRAALTLYFANRLAEGKVLEMSKRVLAMTDFERKQLAQLKLTEAQLVEIYNRCRPKKKEK